MPSAEPIITQYRDGFTLKIHCSGCGLIDEVSDFDLVRATKIEFHHECKQLLPNPSLTTSPI